MSDGTIKLRRLRFDLIYTYKVLFGLVDIDSDALLVLNKTDVARGHSYKLYIHPQSRIDVYKYFCSRTVIHCLDTLPALMKISAVFLHSNGYCYRSDPSRFTLRSV